MVTAMKNPVVTQFIGKVIMNNPTDTQQGQQAAWVDVTDAMVHSLIRSQKPFGEIHPSDYERMRAALEAALSAQPAQGAWVDRRVAIRLAQYGAEYAYRHKDWSIEPLQDGCEEHIDGWIAQASDVPTAEPADGMCNANNPERRCVCREEFGHRVCEPVAQGEAVDLPHLPNPAVAATENSWGSMGHIAAEPAYYTEAQMIAYVKAAYVLASEQRATHSEFMQLADRVSGEFDKIDKLLEQPAGRQGEAVGYTQMTVGGYAVATLHAHALNLPDGTKLYTHPTAPVGNTVRLEADAWQKKWRDYPDEWGECSKEAFDVISRVPDSPWVARELFEHPAAPVGVPDGCLPFTDAVIDKMQNVMAVHGFVVPVRVISDAFNTTREALAADPSAPQGVE